MEFSRQEDWNGLLFPPLGELPDPGIEPPSLVPSVLAGRFFTTVPPLEIMLMKIRNRLNTPLMGDG